MRSLLRASRSVTLVAVAFLAACSAPPGDDVGNVEEAVKVCPGGTTLKGVDVSHYDGTIDWAKVKASGRAFAIMKVTEGTSYFDPTFDANWSGTKANGVVRGAYHFFHSNMDPIAQADWLLAKMGPLQPGDLPPTLDLEVTDGQSAATITKTAIAWLDHIASKTGMKPILYTSPSFVSGTLGSPAGFETHATLWIANWGVTCPDVPSPFTTWAFWQYDDKGTVPGIPASAVDLDEFDGTLAQLTALTKPTTKPDAGVDTGPADTGTKPTADAATGDAAQDDAVDDTATSDDATSAQQDARSDAKTAFDPSADTSSPNGCACGVASTRERSRESAAWSAIALLALASLRRRRSVGALDPCRPSMCARVRR